MTPNTGHPKTAGTPADLLARHRAVLPSWLALYYDEPIELVSGEGRRVTDGSGRTYLDFFGGILTTMTGYNVPEVVDAIREQAGRMLHTSTLYLIRPMIELAEQVAELSNIPDAKVFFGTSGTEATEAALLFATQARRSSQVLALRNSYHGRSFAAMGITGNRGWSASSLTPLQISYLHHGDRTAGPFRDLSDHDFLKAIAADTREVIETTTSGDVAALIAEPIQGVGGFVTPPDGFFAAIKEVLDEYGILFISDEVQTGWGRTGEHFWGIEAHGVRPDLMTFAKGLGNGLAIGGVVGRGDLVDSVNANSISTFGGNPLATAGALANLRYLLDHDLQGNARAQGERLRSGLQQLVDKYGVLGEVRGKGLMIGLTLLDPAGAPSPSAATAVLAEARKHGLLIGKGGLAGNALRIAPPLSVTAAEVDEALDILTRSIDTIDRQQNH
ncbi:MAG TPA: aspartate aminotransferase family protein [Mycobacteriales bacterium]|nr:aspartate aminotransferase family protein [Mycobacteriales bacterium]